MTRALLLGVRIDDLSRPDLIGAMIAAARQRKRARIYNVNLNALNISFACPQFRRSLRSADVVYNDGVGVCVAATVVRQHIHSRHTVGDWLDDLASRASRDGVSLFLLGDEPGIASAAAARMSKRYPALRIAGTHHGFFSPVGLESRRVLEAINTVKPGLLLVGMGMPLQEFWIDANRESLDAGAFVPVGAAFRWYAGVEQRGPRWLTDNGGEWLWRLGQHPVRLFTRYVIGNPLFALRLFEAHLLERPLPTTCAARFRNSLHTCGAALPIRAPPVRGSCNTAGSTGAIPQDSQPAGR